MAREDLHFRLRIPEDLKKRVEKAAEANHRSMTAEIIARLEASFGIGSLGLTNPYRDVDVVALRKTIIELMKLLDSDAAKKIDALSKKSPR